MEKTSIQVTYLPFLSPLGSFIWKEPRSTAISPNTSTCSVVCILWFLFNSINSGDVLAANSAASANKPSMINDQNPSERFYRVASKNEQNKLNCNFWKFRPHLRALLNGAWSGPIRQQSSVRHFPAAFGSVLLSSFLVSCSFWNSWTTAETRQNCPKIHTESSYIFKYLKIRLKYIIFNSHIFRSSSDRFFRRISQRFLKRESGLKTEFARRSP